MSKLVVQVANWTAERWADHIRAIAPEIAVTTSEDPALLGDVRYAVVWQPKPGFLSALPNLEVIFNLGAGVDALLADKTLPDKPLVRIVDPSLTGRMTEWVVLHTLLHLRQHLTYTAMQQARDFRELEQPSAREVTVGIMGMGELGQDAARVLLALGFPVIGWSRSRKQVPGVTCHAGAGELDGFLAQTDILIGLLPLTAETRGVFNLDLFRKLKRDGPLGGPVFLNAGRGGSQVGTDILTALGEGTLYAASLDVFETEPLPEDSPLWSHPRIVVTPHIAAASEPIALARYVVSQIRNFEAGKPLLNLVDRARGY